MSSTLEIRLAGASDLDSIFDILDGAAKWLLDSGIKQWPYPHPRPPIEAALHDRQLWAGARDGKNIATFRTSLRDDEVWPGDNTPALYIHSLAKVRNEPRVASHVFEWAREKAIDDKLQSIRIDCWSGNTALRDFYLSLGFEHLDDVDQYMCDKHWQSSRLQLHV